MALPPDFAELNSMVGMVPEDQELEAESNQESRPTGERDVGEAGTDLDTNGSTNDGDIREVAEDGDVPMDHPEADPAWRNQNPAMAAEEEVIHGMLSDKGL